MKCQNGKPYSCATLWPNHFHAWCKHCKMELGKAAIKKQVQSKEELLAIKFYVRAMKIALVIITIMIMINNHAVAQTQLLPQPFTGGSCPYGFSRSGSFCVPQEGAQDAVLLPPNGSCPWGWTRSGSFCLRSGDSR